MSTKRVIAITAFIASAAILNLGWQTTAIPPKSPLIEASNEAPHQETAPTQGKLFPIVRVVDGDTIVADIDGRQEKIRLIGVDTPETVDPRKTVQCFGKEASANTKTLLADALVRFEVDPSQGDRDKYGRLLRYVFLADGTLVNKLIIAEGYGHEYTYRIPYRHQTDFKAAERTAREHQKGLWAPDACAN